jgi:hypothetical protein
LFAAGLLALVLLLSQTLGLLHGIVHGQAGAGGHRAYATQLVRVAPARDAYVAQAREVPDAHEAPVAAPAAHSPVGFLARLFSGHVHAHDQSHGHGHDHENDHDHDYGSGSGSGSGSGADAHASDDADDDTTACRLFDQSSHCDLMPGVPLLALPLLLTPFVFSVLTGLALARWHALFQARGPPLVR